jgi:hypothetical protein
MLPTSAACPTTDLLSLPLHNGGQVKPGIKLSFACLMLGGGVRCQSIHHARTHVQVDVDVDRCPKLQPSIPAQRQHGPAISSLPQYSNGILTPCHRTGYACFCGCRGVASCWVMERQITRRPHASSRAPLPKSAFTKGAGGKGSNEVQYCHGLKSSGVDELIEPWFILSQPSKLWVTSVRSWCTTPHPVSLS